jgi:hypothetical protein
MSDYYAAAEDVLPIFRQARAPAQQHSVTSMQAADAPRAPSG